MIWYQGVFPLDSDRNSVHKLGENGEFAWIWDLFWGFSRKWAHMGPMGPWAHGPCGEPNLLQSTSSAFLLHAKDGNYIFVGEPNPNLLQPPSYFMASSTLSERFVFINPLYRLIWEFTSYNFLVLRLIGRAGPKSTYNIGWFGRNPASINLA